MAQLKVASSRDKEEEIRLPARAQPQSVLYPKTVLEKRRTQELGCGFATVSSMRAEQEPVSRGLDFGI